MDNTVDFCAIAKTLVDRSTTCTSTEIFALSQPIIIIGSVVHNDVSYAARSGENHEYSTFNKQHEYT